MSCISLIRYGPLVGVAQAGPDAALPEAYNILGTGTALLAACVAAASLGRGAAVLRATRKDHGTRQLIDGQFDANRPTALYYCSEEERLLATAAGLDVAAWMRVPLSTSESAVPLTSPAPSAAPVDLATTATLLRDGPYVRSSGQVAPTYFETLRAAYDYPVAHTFAEYALGLGHWNSVVGVLSGGAYLAAVLGLHAAVPVFVADPQAAVEASVPNNMPRPVAVIDDLINTGAAAGACRALVGASDILSLYGLDCDVPGNMTTPGRIIVGAWLYPSLTDGEMIH